MVLQQLASAQAERVQALLIHVPTVFAVHQRQPRVIKTVQVQIQTQYEPFINFVLECPFNAQPFGTCTATTTAQGTCTVQNTNCNNGLCCPGKMLLLCKFIKYCTFSFI